MGRGGARTPGPASRRRRISGEAQTTTPGAAPPPVPRIPSRAPPPHASGLGGYARRPRCSRAVSGSTRHRVRMTVSQVAVRFGAPNSTGRGRRTTPRPFRRPRLVERPRSPMRPVRLLVHPSKRPSSRGELHASTDSSAAVRSQTVSGWALLGVRVHVVARFLGHDPAITQRAYASRDIRCAAR
jgi:hypothetical protein